MFQTIQSQREENVRNFARRLGYSPGIAPQSRPNIVPQGVRQGPNQAFKNHVESIRQQLDNLKEAEEARAAAKKEWMDVATAAAKSEKEKTGVVWEVYWDNTKNLPYYYNSNTNETVWELPDNKKDAGMQNAGKKYHTIKRQKNKKLNSKQRLTNKSKTKKTKKKKSIRKKKFRKRTNTKKSKK